MQAIVVVESMFGSTSEIADAIREGMHARGSVSVVSVGKVEPARVAQADVVIVGGPTHMHGMSTLVSRQDAALLALEPFAGLTLAVDAAADGVREWLELLHTQNFPKLYAAFDTRVQGLRVISGAASNGIDNALRELGSQPVLPPISFLVGPNHKLVTGELERANKWGDRLVRAAELLLP